MSSFINKMFNTSFLQNKFVLYASLFVVLFSIVRHISNRNINAVVLMALIGLVTSYFSKNMIIILLTAFSTVFVLEILGYQGVMEGMENKKNDESVEGEEDAKEDESKKSESYTDKPKEKPTQIHSYYHWFNGRIYRSYYGYWRWFLNNSCNDLYTAYANIYGYWYVTFSNDNYNC